MGHNAVAQLILLRKEITFVSGYHSFKERQKDLISLNQHCTGKLLNKWSLVKEVDKEHTLEGQGWLMDMIIDSQSPKNAF